MAYSPTVWADGATKLGPTNLNKLENGIFAAYRNYNAKDSAYGAVGNGVADDTAAITAAESAATGDLVYLPSGTYKTTLAGTQFTGRFRGEGQLLDSSAHKRGPWFSALTAPPSSLGDWGGVITAFSGDLSHMQIAMEHRITGATTLGQPSTGYVQSPECGPIGVFLYNESGWNQNTASGDSGRTAVHAFSGSCYHAGLGDAGCFTGGTFVSGQKPSYTHFSANGAGILFNGTVQAGADAVYLNPIEIVLQDNGHDVAGNGLVLNFNRTNNTGAAGTYWNGVRIQNAGSKPVDVGFMAFNGGSGDGYSVGLDLSSAGLSTTGNWVSAAVTLKGNQRIYFNASGTDAGVSAYRRPDSTGNTFIFYDTAATQLKFVVGGVAAMLLSSGQITVAESMFMADGTALFTGTTTGMLIASSTSQKIGFYGQTPIVRPTGWTAATNTKTRTTFDTTTVTLPVLAAHVGALMDDLIALGLIGA